MTGVIDKPVLTVPHDRIVEFCNRWKIQELALFGSALREDFRPESDLDFVATFASEANWGLLEHIQMESELQRLFGRDVDLLSRRSIEQSQNWLLREEILSTARVLFRSGGATDAAR